MKHTHQHFIGGIIALLAILTPFAHAAESTSFKLYDEFPNYATRAATVSTNFQMNENGLTWQALPIVSNNFMIVTAPPVASSSVATSSVQSSTDTEGTDEPGGGRRSRPSSQSSQMTTPSSQAVSSARSRSSLRPAAPRSSAPARPAGIASRPASSRGFDTAFEEELDRRELFTFDPRLAHGAAEPEALLCPQLTGQSWLWLIILLLSLVILLLSFYIAGQKPQKRTPGKRPHFKRKSIVFRS